LAGRENQLEEFRTWAASAIGYIIRDATADRMRSSPPTNAMVVGVCLLCLGEGRDRGLPGSRTLARWGVRRPSGWGPRVVSSSFFLESPLTTVRVTHSPSWARLGVGNAWRLFGSGKTAIFAGGRAAKPQTLRSELVVRPVPCGHGGTGRPRFLFRVSESSG